MLAEFAEVDLGNHPEEVGRPLDSPALVEYDVFYAVLCGEIDVILVCVVIDSGLEVDSV